MLAVVQGTEKRASVRSRLIDRSATVQLTSPDNDTDQSSEETNGSSGNGNQVEADLDNELALGLGGRVAGGHDEGAQGGDASGDGGNDEKTLNGALIFSAWAVEAVAVKRSMTDSPVGADGQHAEDEADERDKGACMEKSSEHVEHAHLAFRETHLPTPYLVYPEAIVALYLYENKGKRSLPLREQKN